jgi:hypothetical protein
MGLRWLALERPVGTVAYAWIVILMATYLTAEILVLTVRMVAADDFRLIRNIGICHTGWRLYPALPLEVHDARLADSAQTQAGKAEQGCVVNGRRRG